MRALKMTFDGGADYYVPMPAIRQALEGRNIVVSFIEGGRVALELCDDGTVLRSKISADAP